MDASIWLAVASAAFAGGGLVFSGIQTMLARSDRQRERKVELAGVSLSWVTTEAPHRAEADGTATWVFAITLHNPGRMPIDGVRGEVRFGTTVRRKRYDGTLDEPTDTFTLHAPVIPGGGTRQWRREIVAPWDRRDDVYAMTSVVTFRDVDGRDRTNHWPRNSAPSR